MIKSTKLLKSFIRKIKLKNFETLKTQIHPNTPEVNEQILLKNKLNKLFNNKKKEIVKNYY